MVVGAKGGVGKEAKARRLRAHGESSHAAVDRFSHAALSNSSSVAERNVSARLMMSGSCARPTRRSRSFDRSMMLSRSSLMRAHRRSSSSGSLPKNPTSDGFERSRFQQRLNQQVGAVVCVSSQMVAHRFVVALVEVGGEFIQTFRCMGSDQMTMLTVCRLAFKNGMKASTSIAVLLRSTASRAENGRPRWGRQGACSTSWQATMDAL